MVNSLQSHATVAKLLRHLPTKLPGKIRLAHLLFRHALSETDVLLHDCDGNQFMVPQLAEPIAFHLLANGSYETETESFILNRLSEGDTFLDVGANIGVFTVAASRRVGPRGRVIAIEASPRILGYLEKNIELNQLENVTTLGCAASDTRKTDSAFYEAPVAKFGMGSLTPQFNTDPVSVNTETLDDLIGKHHVEDIAVLKVDVEGHEAAVFRGASKRLRSPRAPAIIFEFCDWAEARFAGSHVGDAQEYLMALGYYIFRVSELNRGLRRPLLEPLTEGCTMLAALRN